MALNALDVLVGDIDVDMPLEQLRCLSAICRSIAHASQQQRATASASATAPAHASHTQLLQLRFFLQRAKAHVRLAPPPTISDSANSLVIEVR